MFFIIKIFTNKTHISYKYFRHYRYEQKLACLLWKIDMKDVTIIPTETTETVARNKNMVGNKSF